MNKQQSFTKNLIDEEKQFLTRLFRFTTVGSILLLTVIVTVFIAINRLMAFNEEAKRVMNEHMMRERGIIQSRVEQIKKFSAHQLEVASDESVSMMMTAVDNVYAAINESYKRHGRTYPKAHLQGVIADLRNLHDLNIADVNHDNSLFIMAYDGTLLLESNNPQLEGKKVSDMPAALSLLERAKKSHSGVYSDSYPFGKHDKAIVYARALPKVNIVIGSHVDHLDMLYFAKMTALKGLKNIFFEQDNELIVADLDSKVILIHKQPDVVNKNISEVPKLIGDFYRVFESPQDDNHFRSLECIKDTSTMQSALKTMYVDVVEELGLIVSTGFFESDFQTIVDKQIKTLKTKMFNEMLVLVGVILSVALLVAMAGLRFKERLSASFDYFAERIIQAHKELTATFVTDPLTKLGNRNALYEQVKGNRNIATAIVNIDQFSRINDYYGSEVGDAVIIRLGEILSDHFSQQHYSVYRLHSDEFAVLLKGSDDLEAQLRPNIRHLISQLRSRVEHIKEIPISIHLSAGLSQGNERPLLKARTALKTAKERNRDCMSYEQSGDRSSIHKKHLEMTNRLKWAFENDQIFPLFQPIKSLKNGVIEKYECLVRMRDEHGETIPPGEFLETAMQGYLYHDITRIMFQKSIAHFEGTDTEFSINITLSDILHEETRHSIFGQIVSAGVEKQIILEIVESEALELNTEVNAFFEKARRIGCRIAIDDFGTGYSNFNYLNALQPDFLKIDGSIIQNLKEGNEQERILRLLVDFASESRIETVAEFVASESLLEHVTRLGIDYAQGYFVGEPRHLS